MAPRAYWKGHIRLSLVSFPVRVFAAVTSSEKISLHQYDRESGDRIRYKKVADDTSDEVQEEDIVKGYEYEKGSFIPIEDDDLEHLKLESRHTIDLVQFTDSRDIDPIYFDRPYYVAPDGEIAEEAFLTVREALKASKKAAIGQVVLSGKERIVCLRPCGRGIVMETLRYAYEVREAEKYFDDISEDTEIDDEQLELARQLIEQKTKAFDPKSFKDHYQEGLMEIIQAKIKGQEITVSEGRPRGAQVINIVDALRKSLEESGGRPSKKPAKKKKGKSGKKAA